MIDRTFVNDDGINPEGVERVRLGQGQRGFAAVERAPRVGPVERGDETLRAVEQVLAPAAERERLVRQRDFEVYERLVEVDVVLIQPRPLARLAAVDAGGDHLHEPADVWPEVRVDVPEEPAKVVAVIVLLTRRTEVEVVEPLVAVARLPAERKVPIALVIERDVLDRIPAVGVGRRPEEAVVLVPAYQRVRRRGRGWRGRGLRLCDERGCRGEEDGEGGWNLHLWSWSFPCCPFMAAAPVRGAAVQRSFPTPLPPVGARPLPRASDGPGIREIR